MTKLEQAARQALEALENYGIDGTKSVGGIKCTEAITTLRESLAEPVKQSISEEAFNWIDANAPMFVREALANTRSSIRSTSEYSDQTEQEPLMITPGGGAFPFAVVGELEQAEQEPVLCVECGKPTMHMGNKCYACCQKDTKDLEDALKSWDAAPVRTKDLTDDEIEAIFEYWYSQPETEVWSTVDLARAVIAADREKNR